MALFRLLHLASAIPINMELKIVGTFFFNFQSRGIRSVLWETIHAKMSSAGFIFYFVFRKQYFDICNQNQLKCSK